MDCLELGHAFSVYVIYTSKATFGLKIIYDYQILWLKMIATAIGLLFHNSEYRPIVPVHKLDEINSGSGIQRKGNHPGGGI